MKTALLYILLCLFAVTIVSAQEDHEVYRVTNQGDSARIMADIKAGYALQNSYFDSSTGILKRALVQSREINFNNGIANALVYLAMGYTAAGDENQSLENYLEALPYAKSCSNYNKEILATLYTGIGTPYVRKRDFNNAGYYYYKGLQEIMNERLQYSSIASHLFVNLSNFWKIMNRYDYGLLYLRQAQRVAEYNKDTISMVAIYVSLGGSYYHNDQMKEAFAYSFLAEKIAAQKHLIGLQQITLNNIGIYLRDEKKPLEAITYFKKAIALADDEHGYQHNLSSYYNLGFAYYDVGDYKESKKYVLSTLNKAKRLNIDREDLGSAMQILSMIYQKEKKYDTANYWLNKFVAFTDSVTQIQKDSSISKLETNYRLYQKDKVIAQKQIELSQNEVKLKNKNIWIIGISSGILLLIAVSFGFYMVSKHKQRTQTAQIRNLEQGKELSDLKAMLAGEEKERTRLARELHDGIGGMLTAAKLNLGSVKKEHPELGNITELDDIIRLLSETAAEVRQTAHNLMPDVLIKNGLKDALLLYCASINTIDLLNVDIQFHGDLERISKSAQLILYRITQELIQNIVKHARATEAIIQIIQDNDRLNLIVEDNGEGFDVLAGGMGFGLQNLEYRVKALQGYISVTSDAGKGTVVYIEFDLEKLT